MRFPGHLVELSCSRYRLVSLVTALLFVGFGLLWAPRAEIDPYSVFNPDSIKTIDPAAQALRDRFPPFEIMTVLYEPDDDPFSVQVLREIAGLTDRLSAIAGVGEVQSVVTTRSPVTEGETFALEPLVEGMPTDTGVTRLRALLRDDPLLASFLMPPDRSGWNILITANGDTDAATLAKRVMDELGFSPTLHYGGYPYYLERMVSYVTGDTTRLLAVIVAVTLLVEIILLRSVGRAVVVWMTAAGAVTVLLGIFSAMGHSFGVEMLLVSALVLIVTTSYGIHVVRLQDSDRLSPCGAAAQVSPVVWMAAVTTMLGFGTLLISTLPRLTVTALYALGGILVAFWFSLAPGPVLLGAVHPQPSERYGNPGALGGKGAPERRSRVSRLMAGIAAAGAGVALVFVVSGIGFLRATPGGPQHLFRPATDAYRSIRYFVDTYGSTSDLLLYIDSGSEYGLVDGKLMAAIGRFEDEVRTDGVSGEVLGYPDLVSWFWDRYGTPVESRYTTEAVGETFEMLRTGNGLFSMESFVDPSYRYARILVRIDDFALPTDVTAYADDLIARLEGTGRDYSPDFAAYAAGISYDWSRELLIIIQSLLRGVFVFFPALFLLLTAAMRSPKKAVILVIPSIVAVLVYLGLAGWLHLPFTTVMAIGMALVMGVSVDDSVYLGLYRAAHGDASLYPARRAVTETTIVIVAGLLSLIGSRIGPVAPMALLASVALAASTATVVLVVPRLLVRFRL